MAGEDSIPLAVDRLVEDSVDHIVMVTTVGIDRVESRLSEKAESTQVVPGAENDICRY